MPCQSSDSRPVAASATLHERRRNSEPLDAVQDRGEQLTWHRNFGHLKCHVLGMPDDLAAGAYTFGAIIDDLDDIAEEYKDNNAVTCCKPLAVRQWAPVIHPFNQQIIPCGRRYVSRSPTVTHPLNMAPMTWSLDNPEPGMTIDRATGVIRWESPIRSPFLYTIRVRATNAASSSTEMLFLGVETSVPQITPIADQAVGCPSEYVGPTPAVTSPDCMEPILLWSLDDGPPGMSIDQDTGIISWSWNGAGQSPDRSSPAAQPVTIRAINAVGSGTVSWIVHWTCGDLDHDGSVALTDLAMFVLCVTGPEIGVRSGCPCADTDGDGDVDLADVQMFQRAFGR